MLVFGGVFKDLYIIYKKKRTIIGLPCYFGNSDVICVMLESVM